MRRFLLLCIRHPMWLAAQAWLVLILSAVLTYILLPIAQEFHNGDYQLFGYLLHRAFLFLFFLVVVMAVTAFLLEFAMQVTKPNIRFGQQIWNMVKGFFVAGFAAVAGSGAIYLLLFGSYLGMSLG